MIGYVPVVTNDFARAAAFYDALLAELDSNKLNVVFRELALRSLEVWARKFYERSGSQVPASTGERRSS